MTQIRQERINDLSRASIMFSRSREGVMPLVLVPAPRGSASCCLRIPSDAHVVFQSWGKDVAPYAAGLRCLCSWHRVAYLVTRQTCTYNAPVQNVPTKDNVKVGVDLTIVFSVTDARKFVYGLGARRFDEMLHAATEEAIRGLVRDTSVGHIYELRGIAAQNMLRDLNVTFEEFGVSFSSCTVTSVQLPDQLAKSLQNATMFESKINEEEKKYDYAMSQLVNAAAKDKRKQDIKNEKLQKELLNKTRRAEIDMDKARIEGERSKEVAIMKTEEAARVEQQRAEAELKNAKVNSERDSIIKKQHVESKTSGESIAADQEARSIVIRAEASEMKMRNKTLSRQAAANAEMEASDMLSEKRKHEVELLKLDIVERLSRKGQLFISGDDGDKIIHSILNAADFK